MARIMAYQALDKISVEEITAVGVPADEAESLHVELGDIIRKHGISGPATWREISNRMLTPELPFALHQMMYYGCYRAYASSTPPAWIPSL